MIETNRIIMEPTHQITSHFLKVDFIIQLILIILMVLTIPTVFYPFLIAIPFGAWQVMSGIIGVIYGSKWRRMYLLIVGLYFSIGYAFISIFQYGSMPFESVLYLFTFLVPLVLGITYFAMTYREYMASKETKSATKEKYDTEILDAEFREKI